MIVRAIAVMLVASSCGCAADSANPHQSLPVREIRLTGELRLESTAIATIGDSDVDPGYTLHLVQDARFLSGGRVAIAQETPPSVLLFDSTGAFVRELAREGDGPGEVKRVRSIHPLGADSLVLWDVVPQRITLLLGSDPPTTGDLRTAADPDGLRESARHRPYNLYALGGDRGVLVHREGAPNPRGLDRADLFASIVNLKGEYLAHVGDFEGSEWYRGVPLPLGNPTHFAATAGTLYASDHSAPEIVTYDSAGQATIRLHLPISQDVITADDERRAIDAFLGLVSSAAKQSVAEILADAPFPDSTPAITALKSSRDGRLWVRAYSPPDAATRRWYVVNPVDGTAQSIDIPARYSVQDATSGRVLLMTTDSLDREVLIIASVRQSGAY